MSVSKLYHDQLDGFFLRFQRKSLFWQIVHISVECKYVKLKFDVIVAAHHPQYILGGLHAT